MKSVVVWDYFATGEGNQIKILFSNSSRMSEEDAVNKLKERLDPYYHVGIEVLPLESIQFNKAWMSLIQAHVPALHSFIESDRNYVINVDYSFYVNYS
jgi:hypothetical protein